MAFIATFGRHKTDTAIADQITVITEGWKKESVATTGAYGDIIKKPTSWSDSGSEEPHHSSSSRHRFKNCQAKHEDHHINLHSSSMKSSRESSTPKQIRNRMVRYYLRHDWHGRQRRARHSRVEIDSSIDRHEKYWHTRKKYLVVIRPVNYRFREAFRLSGIPSCEYVVMLRWWGCSKRRQKGQKSSVPDELADVWLVLPHLHYLFFISFKIGARYEQRTRRRCPLAVPLFHEALRCSRAQHPHRAPPKVA